MKFFESDRRKDDRRQQNDGSQPVERRSSLDIRHLLVRELSQNPDQADRRQADRRENQRRQSQRREFFRVIYPPNVSPVVLDTNYEIIDISCKGIRFYCKDDQCQPPVKISQPLDLKIQFQDQEIVHIQGRILRCFMNPDLNAKVYCALLTEGFSPKRINDEQRYLLKHFPDFYRSLES